MPSSSDRLVPAEASSPPGRVKVSVVVPVSARRDDLETVYRAYSAAMTRVEPDHEFIFVFDGTAAPPDAAFLSLARQDERLRVWSLSHAFGETGALRAGFAESTGDVILTLPAYLQVVPEAVDRLLSALRQDVDLVITRREPRHDGWFNRLQNRAFHALVRRLTGANFRDIACGARAIRRSATEHLPLYGDLHRFIPAFARQQGLEVIELPVEQHPADRTRRVYGLGTYIRRVLDVFTVLFLLKFTEKPLRFFGLIALWFVAIGTAITGWLGIQRLAGVGIANRPLLLIGVLLIALGVQIAGLGLVGEIVVHWRAEERRLYRVKRSG